MKVWLLIWISCPLMQGAPIDCGETVVWPNGYAKGQMQKMRAEYLTDSKEACLQRAKEMNVKGPPGMFVPGTREKFPIAAFAFCEQTHMDKERIAEIRKNSEFMRSAWAKVVQEDIERQKQKAAKK